jgi:hypothetical protein
MPANSSLPTRLPMCFPSRSRQFSERAPRKGAPVVPRISFQRVLGNQHRLPSFQCYRDPPSLQPARGIPSSAAATPVRLYVPPQLSPLNRICSCQLTTINDASSVHPPARSPSSSASAPLRAASPPQRSRLNRSCSYQLTVAGCWIPSLDSLLVKQADTTIYLNFACIYIPIASS